MTEWQPSILITTGEPAGIGPELCARFAAEMMDTVQARIVLVGDINLLAERAQLIGVSVRFVPYCPDHEPEAGAVEVWHTPLYTQSVPGQLAVENGRYVLDTLDIAIDACLKRQFDAVVTAPVHKGVINDAGVSFSGHTEYLAEKSDVDLVVMMLTGGGLRVALVTTHLPLQKVSEAITESRIIDTLAIIDQDLKRRFGIEKPRILVTGLNPHAGEQGHLGHEDDEVILPAIVKAQALGICCDGPIPADTAFLPERVRTYDVFLTMYHDQGLPVLKYASFGGGSNITLGLPFIRTSVDHGTALALAGSGKADMGSLQTAITHAIEMGMAAKRYDAGV